jgi:hypothetical protein
MQLNFDIGQKDIPLQRYHTVSARMINAAQPQAGRHIFLIQLF